MDYKAIGAWLKNLSLLISLAAIAYFGEHGGDGGFIKDIWAQAKMASPFAAMFAILAWLDERRERREANKNCNERTVDFIRSTNLQTGAAEKVGDGMREISGAVREFATHLRNTRRR